MERRPYRIPRPVGTAFYRIPRPVGTAFHRRPKLPRPVGRAAPSPPHSPLHTAHRQLRPPGNSPPCRLRTMRPRASAKPPLDVLTLPSQLSPQHLRRGGLLQAHAPHRPIFSPLRKGAAQRSFPVRQDRSCPSLADRKASRAHGQHHPSAPPIRLQARTAPAVPPALIPQAPLFRVPWKCASPRLRTRQRDRS